MADKFGGVEVCKADVAGGIDEDILSLDVAMQHASVMQRFKRQEQLGAHKSRSHLRQSPALCMTAVQCEVTACTIIKDKV